MKFSVGVLSLFKIGKLQGFALLALLAVMTVVASPSHAGEAELKEQIDKLWDKLANMESTSPSGVKEDSWTDRLTISGLVEVEAFAKDDTVSKSDISVATVELGVDAEISEHSSAHVLLLYEDGTDLQVDEASITMSNLGESPLSLTVGKMYVPFGNFETRMVSDPLTLEIGETGEDAFLGGVEVAGFYASAYVFNGDVNDGGGDKVEHYGANAGYMFESGDVGIDVGGSWISSIQDSDGITDALGGGPVTVSDYIGGYATYLIGSFGPITLIGEYVGADDDINGSGTNSQISSYNIEAGYSFTFDGKEAGLAVGFQATDEALWFGISEERILVAFGVEIMDGSTLALEWLNEEDYDVASGGTGRNWDVYTVQLGVEF